MSDPMMPLPVIEAEPTSVPPAVLLANHLKALKLPSFAREYEKVAFEAAQDRADYPRYLLRLCELERIDGRVRQRGVNSVVASGLHFQAAFGVICSG